MKYNDIKRVAVIGAGIMGHGIAQVCAGAGFHVKLRDVKEEILQQAFDRIKSNLRFLERQGVIKKGDVDTTLSNIQGTTNMKEAAIEADFVIEAVPEHLNLKKQIFKELDEISPQQTILATNSSTFRNTEIASATRRHEKIIGMHWWNPPYIVPLVEIVPGEHTSKETVDITKSFTNKLGKVPIICKESPGFISARIQMAMFNEAVSLVEHGVASAEDIDKATKLSFGFRLPMLGPLEVADYGGLDVWLNASEYLYRELKDSKFKPPNWIREKVEKGDLGIKTGTGFYDYSDKSVNHLIETRNERLIELLKLLKQLGVIKKDN